METTRPARDDDRPVCLELLAQALDGTRLARGGAALVGVATPEDFLARWMSPQSSLSIVYVGEFDHTVVGLAAGTASARRGATELSGRIECCYVEAGARGVGVGTALMESMVSWCAAVGCDDIDAPALPGDRLSKQRLEAAGFSARLLVLNRRLN